MDLKDFVNKLSDEEFEKYIDNKTYNTILYNLTEYAYRSKAML
jgi:hypothetical protein